MNSTWCFSILSSPCCDFARCFLTFGSLELFGRRAQEHIYGSWASHKVFFDVLPSVCSDFRYLVLLLPRLFQHESIFRPTLPSVLKVCAKQISTLRGVFRHRAAQMLVLPSVFDTLLNKVVKTLGKTKINQKKPIK